MDLWICQWIGGRWRRGGGGGGRGVEVAGWSAITITNRASSDMAHHVPLPLLLLLLPQWSSSI
eukprot:COSAG01_NODE_60266_length_295_cov_2.071429_1_plen_62_part_01